MLPDDMAERCALGGEGARIGRLFGDDWQKKRHEKECYKYRFHETGAETPNDPKLSDGGGWRDGCAGEGGGAASVTAAAVRCSA